MTDRLTKCAACDGRGYHRCDCWPADCICANGDEPCEECGGDGFIDPALEQGCYWDDDDRTPSPETRADGTYSGCKSDLHPEYVTSGGAE